MSKPSSGDEQNIPEGHSRLPSKLAPWYQYAAKFVDTIKKKSPKVVVRQASNEMGAKISSVMMLSGLIEVTVKTKGHGGQGSDIVTIIADGPKYETYELEQDVDGLT